MILTDFRELGNPVPCQWTNERMVFFDCLGSDEPIYSEIDGRIYPFFVAAEICRAEHTTGYSSHNLHEIIRYSHFRPICEGMLESE